MTVHSKELAAIAKAVQTLNKARMKNPALILDVCESGHLRLHFGETAVY